MEIILGLFAGAGVCGFGMWAFLRGQRSMAEIRSGGEPEAIKGPIALLREASGAAPKRAEPDYSGQLRAMFGEGTPGARGERSC
ncbi:MAG: hypothetical protein P4M02_06320 [Clostridia bacterium]|nr:hypothetical protein [Clostridia bacterium]